MSSKWFDLNEFGVRYFNRHERFCNSKRIWWNYKIFINLYPSQTINHSDHGRWKKFNLNFYFHTPLWCLKWSFRKPSEAPKRSVKIKLKLIFILIQLSEMHVGGSVNSLLIKRNGWSDFRNFSFIRGFFYQYLIKFFLNTGDLHWLCLIYTAL